MNAFFARLWVFHKNKGILLCTLLQNLSTLHCVNHLKLLQITIALLSVQPSDKYCWDSSGEKNILAGSDDLDLMSLLIEHSRRRRYFRMQTISHLFYLFQESSTSLCCMCKARLTVTSVSVNFIICKSVFAHWQKNQTKFCFPSCAWRWNICQVNFALILSK